MAGAGGLARPAAPSAPEGRPNAGATGLRVRLGPHAGAAALGLPAVALMLVWAAHDGGFDTDTWYWGALGALALLAAAVALGQRRPRLPRAAIVAVVMLGLYVAWSYLSIAWAESPGDALQGSNRALLYLIVFALLLILPWTEAAALVALLAFALGIGVIGMVVLVRLAANLHVGSMVIEGRLATPTGYFNSTAALFTVGALVAISLCTQRRLPALVRGMLAALACGELQLALIVQSRGWLFTLPIVAVLAALVSRDRLRLVVLALPPVAGTVAIVHRLLAVYHGAPGPALEHAAERAGQAGLLVCAAVFVAGTIIAWADSALGPRALPARARRLVGGVVLLGTLGVAVAGATAATHGHPVRFVERQWNGLSQTQTSFSTQSHFVDVGSERWDFWRVALKAFAAHPVGGLGQDNFADYYVIHRRTGIEPAWTHSIELRLLAHTGIVGALLFTAFLVAALCVALRGRRRGGVMSRKLAATALLPLVVWLVHGSIDWFWEMPALSGPALGFLGVAGSLGARHRPSARRADTDRARMRSRHGGAVGVALGVAAVSAAVVVLGLPYLAVRETSLATQVSARDPQAALADLRTAARLNPLDAQPDRLAGAIALENRDWTTALARFDRSIAREREGWFAWLGAGLAASALGERRLAHRDYATAYSINRQQPAIRAALRRVFTPHPLTSAEAFTMITAVG